MKTKAERMARHTANLQRARKSKVSRGMNRLEQRKAFNPIYIIELLDLLR